MGSMDGPLPTHMLTPAKRASQPGPTSGSYITWAICLDDLAANEASAFPVLCPCDLRIEEISFGAAAVTSDPALLVQRASSDLVASVNITTTPTVATLVEAQRTCAKGDILTFTVTADAGDAGEAIMIFVTAYTRGHVQADPVND